MASDIDPPVANDQMQPEAPEVDRNNADDHSAAAGSPAAVLEHEQVSAANASATTRRSSATKASRRKKPTKSGQKAKARSKTPVRKARGTRSFPASSFEDALLLPESIQKFGGGQPIRRLTLFHELGRSPDSSSSRDLIYSSSKYGLTKGTHQSEWLELTPEGDAATRPELSERERARARFSLAIERFAPFKAVYDRYVSNKLPTAAVMRDHVAEAAALDPESASEAVETFIVNAKYVGVLKPIAGVERLCAADGDVEGRDHAPSASRAR